MRKDLNSNEVLQPGEYGKKKNQYGVWYCAPPGRDPFLFMGCLGDGTTHHKVIEHEDGTITVSPSILIKSYQGEWHGFLERGAWWEC